MDWNSFLYLVAKEKGHWARSPWLLLLVTSQMRDWKKPLLHHSVDPCASQATSPRRLTEDPPDWRAVLERGSSVLKEKHILHPHIEYVLHMEESNMPSGFFFRAPGLGSRPRVKLTSSQLSGTYRLWPPRYTAPTDPRTPTLDSEAIAETFPHTGQWHACPNTRLSEIPRQGYWRMQVWGRFGQPKSPYFPIASRDGKSLSLPNDIWIHG